MAAGLARRDRRFGLLMAGPGLAAMLLVILVPILFTLWTSLYDFTLLHPVHDIFVGVANYGAAIADADFRHALGVTLAFVLAVVLLELIVGLAVALALDSVQRGKAIYYAILLCPLLMNPVVVGLIWRMFLHPTQGIVNWLIGLLGLGPVNWLGDPANAFWTLVMVDIWHQVSFMIVLLLAGLSALPSEPYEAARMEGAGRIRAFLAITLPLMRPVITVTLLIRLIFAVRTYDLVYIMTRGGPGNATDLVSYFIYRQAFVTLNIGRAAAMSLILLALVLALTAWLHRYMRSLRS
jgi:multiple sugar transport system permease protein